ncbi:nuclease-related domain-containing DEAD/DEAH box helicase [Aldersonia kunmingensis]|uniref:nuclease-related domain-containing DEAD/DEAH box helicase n=1 Tax=Aldersonia kunmingensis TaxID=408066 RepID=UPI00082DD945|nr:NERD domain-containing protein [Aldersonia kunmingensis]
MTSDRRIEPQFASAAERQVWQALRVQLPDTALLRTGQRVTDHSKDHEIDFLVAIEGAGVVCLEVKGGEVWHDGERWRRGDVDEIKDPVAQSRDACYALRRYVEDDHRWTQSRPRWDHMVVLPNVELPADFALPECPRWKVIDRTELDHMLEKIMHVLVNHQAERPSLSGAGLDELSEVLNGRGLPQRDVVSRGNAHEDAANVLTRQQCSILDAIRLLPRVEVRGGAGSGKTFLALEQARRLQKEGKRTALLCYSHGLASYLRRVTAGWHYKERPAYVGEFHSLGLKWGAPTGPEESERGPAAVQFWEVDLPAKMVELAQQLPPGQRFDAVVIDEAQDFATEWWTAVLAALRDPESGCVYAFNDEGQRVFDRFGAVPVQLIPILLEENLRNTVPIAETFKPLVGQKMRLRGGEGPDVRFVECGALEALGAADDQIDVLLEEGWRPEDLALLVIGSRHPEQVERQREGHEAYWDSFWDTEQVFYGHVLGFKGLERRAVVLALNDDANGDRVRERLYVGLSRARDQLVVCGDPDFIRDVGGPELARKLGL